MTIGKLAEAGGVPTSTVRFYERAGLLPAEQRSPAGRYRVYTQNSVERLRFIRAAQAVGLSVKDIGELLDLTTADTSACDDVQQLLKRRLGEVRQRMKDLRRIERTLDAALRACCRGSDPGICERVEAMRGGIGKILCTRP